MINKTKVAIIQALTESEDVPEYLKMTIVKVICNTKVPEQTWLAVANTPPAVKDYADA